VVGAAVAELVVEAAGSGGCGEGGEGLGAQRVNEPAVVHPAGGDDLPLAGSAVTGLVPA
jgi:hypothetical protein